MESTKNIIEVSYRFEGNSNYEHDFSDSMEGVRELFDSFIELEQNISDITITVKADNLDELSTLLWQLSTGGYQNTKKDVYIQR